MGGKRYSTEQTIVKLRQAEIEMGRGVKVPEVCRKLGIPEQTFYRWRKRYGGLDRSEVHRIRSAAPQTRKSRTVRGCSPFRWARERRVDCFFLPDMDTPTGLVRPQSVSWLMTLRCPTSSEGKQCYLKRYLY
jgi:transposase-like protein